MLSKLDLSDTVKVNENLCPVVFETPEQIFSTVKDGLMRIAGYWWGQNNPLADGKPAQDIVLYGDLVSYVYNQFSEASVGLLFPDLPEHFRSNLDEINDVLVSTEDAYKFITRPVHCRFLTELPAGIPTYSLAQDKWLVKPVKRQFSFSIAEFAQVLDLYRRNIRDNVEMHSKNPNGTFTIEGCHQLEAYLKYMRSEAQKAWLESEEHEYNFDYLLWRTFCTLGGDEYFKRILTTSYNYNINELEQC